jgi:hypothetical protein
MIARVRSAAVQEPPLARSKSADMSAVPLDVDSEMVQIDPPDRNPPIRERGHFERSTHSDLCLSATACQCETYGVNSKRERERIFPMSRRGLRSGWRTGLGTAWRSSPMRDHQHQVVDVDDANFLAHDALAHEVDKLAQFRFAWKERVCLIKIPGTSSAHPLTSCDDLGPPCWQPQPLPARSWACPEEARGARPATSGPLRHFA